MSESPSCICNTQRRGINAQTAHSNHPYTREKMNA